MEKDKDILKQVGRDTGMRVPDGYFEGFTSRMVSQLDNFEVVEPEKPTVWQRVRPWLYMAAMFAGIALMVRLFANMMGGHMIILSLISLIFIFGAFGAVVIGATTVVSVLFSLFMLLIDTLVSFIQAYVFTMLSTLFIALAQVDGHHEGKVEEIK